MLYVLVTDWNKDNLINQTMTKLPLYTYFCDALFIHIFSGPVCGTDIFTTDKGETKVKLMFLRWIDIWRCFWRWSWGHAVGHRDEFQIKQMRLCLFLCCRKLVTGPPLQEVRSSNSWITLFTLSLPVTQNRHSKWSVYPNWIMYSYGIWSRFI